MKQKIKTEMTEVGGGLIQGSSPDKNMGFVSKLHRVVMPVLTLALTAIAANPLQAEDITKNVTCHPQPNVYVAFPIGNHGIDEGNIIIDDLVFAYRTTEIKNNIKKYGKEQEFDNVYTYEQSRIVMANPYWQGGPSLLDNDAFYNPNTSQKKVSYQQQQPIKATMYFFVAYGANAIFASGWSYAMYVSEISIAAKFGYSTIVFPCIGLSVNYFQKMGEAYGTGNMAKKDEAHVRVICKGVKEVANLAVESFRVGYTLYQTYDYSQWAAGVTWGYRDFWDRVRTAFNYRIDAPGVPNNEQPPDPDNA